MISSTCIALLAWLHLGAGPSSGVAGIKEIIEDTKEERIERKSIPEKSAREALVRLIVDRAFLSDSPHLQSLKIRIQKENERESLLRIPSGSTYWHGNTLGSWIFDVDNKFSYVAKSPAGTELFLIRGIFAPHGKDQWTARMTEASTTRLYNPFGKKEYDAIKVGMNQQEVIRLLGVPPGAYFAGPAAFQYHSGRRFSPFEGYGKEFEFCHPQFFGGKSASRWRMSAWISNDMAIWITFDEKGEVRSRFFDRVAVLGESDLSKSIRRLFPHMMPYSPTLDR